MINFHDIKSAFMHELAPEDVSDFDAHAEIATEAGIEDMIAIIASIMSNHGKDQFMEGMGYVSINGHRPKENWCGVDIQGDFDIDGMPTSYVEFLD